MSQRSCKKAFSYAMSFACGFAFAIMIIGHDFAKINDISFKQYTFINGQRISTDGSAYVYRNVSKIKFDSPDANRNVSKTKWKWKGKLIRYKDREWKEQKCVEEPRFKRSFLSFPARTPIFVYHTAEDRYVSGTILSGRLWEHGFVNNIFKILKDNPKTVFLDIGSNIGVFTLTAAKAGNNVIAIDCLRGNVMRLCASMIAGKLTDRITIIHNALSNTRTNFSIGGYKGNVGGTYIKNINDTSASLKKSIINSILLDDLLHIFELNDVVMKMDVETHEAKVLAGAEKFFSNVLVKYLLIEIMAHRGKDSGHFILDFLTRHNMKVVPTISRKYNHSDGMKNWPNTVLFKNKNV